MLWKNHAIGLSISIYFIAANMQITESLREKIGSLGNQVQSAAKRAGLLEKLGDHLRKSGDSNAAAKAFKEALAALGQCGDSSKRLKLCQKLCRPTKGWPKAQAEHFCKLLQAGQEILQLEKAIAPLKDSSTPGEEIDPRLFELSARTGPLLKKIRAENDPMLEARALAIDAKLSSAGGYPDEALRKLEQAAACCADGACPALAAECLQKAALLAQGLKDARRAYVLLAKAAWEKTAGLPDQERRYGRTGEMDRACEELGQGHIACAGIEIEQTGLALLHDYSRQSLPGPLPRSSIEEVHRQALSLLYLCLQQESRAGRIEPGDSFELFWAITNQGGTDRFQLSPADAPAGLRTCLEQAVAAFRYPRYTGQRQTVTVPLSLR